MKPLILYFIAALTFTAFLASNSVTGSENIKTHEPEKPSVKDLMHNFAQALIDANAFSLSSNPFKKEDQEKRAKAIAKLAESASQIDLKTLPESGAYKISLKALQQHFSEIERAYKYGNDYYGKWMLNATGALCVMCHTQTPSSSRHINFPGPFKNPHSSDEKFSQSEFLFITRQFNPAMELYNQLIKDYPKNGLNTAQLDVILRRQVTYFARVKSSPSEGVSAMEAALKNESIPEAIQRNLKAWEGLFRKWSRENTSNKSRSAKDILKLVKKEMKKTLWDRMTEANDPRVVSYLKVSGMLYNYLFTHPSTPETPEILLWLGRSENALNNQFFYSLGDLYYKECMESFPKSTAAKECYKEFEASLKKTYQSTTGTEVPPFVEMELSDYRKQIGIK